MIPELQTAYRVTYQPLQQESSQIIVLLKAWRSILDPSSKSIRWRSQRKFYMASF